MENQIITKSFVVSNRGISSSVFAVEWTWCCSMRFSLTIHYTLWSFRLIPIWASKWEWGSSHSLVLGFVYTEFRRCLIISWARRFYFTLIITILTVRFFIYFEESSLTVIKSTRRRSYHSRDFCLIIVRSDSQGVFICTWTWCNVSSFS